MADFYLQLSKCTFDTIGSLSMDTSRDQPKWSVTAAPMTWALNNLGTLRRLHVRD
jgi:hypothetical protein